MDVKKFVLSYYETATENFHITQISRPTEALNLHSHNYFQVYYIVQGTLTHHLNENQAKLSKSDVFILPPDIPHYIESTDENLSFYSMSFLPDYFSGIRESNKLIADFLQYLKTAAKQNILPKLTLPYDDVLFVDTIFKRIITEFNDKKSGSEEIIKECASLLLSIFARIYFAQKTESITSEINKQSVVLCIEYIKNHFDENVSLSEMAKRATMSKTSFCNIFHSITGETFKRYLNIRRIEKAKRLILSGEKITTVSDLCGYEYFSTFYRNFVDIMGVSPAEFKKINTQ